MVGPTRVGPFSMALSLCFRAQAVNERVLVLFEWKAHEGVRVRLRCGLVLVRECLRSGDRWGTGLPLQALQEGTGTGSPVQPGGSRRLPGRLSSSRWVDWAALPLPGRGRNLPRGTDRSDSKKPGSGKSKRLRKDWREGFLAQQTIALGT